MSRRNQRNSGPSLPPPPPRSRSFEELRASVKKLEDENKKLKAKQDEKEEPTPQSIAAKNPNRSAPKPNQPQIKLMNYSTDWIEQERSNVVIELNSDFEDNTIQSHSTIVENDNLSLLGKSDEQVQKVVKTYESYSVLNLAYRLLITLPASYRLEAKSLLDALQSEEAPKNTPVICEMLSHIGKTRTSSFGNLRLRYPLQLAKKKIVKSCINLKGFKEFSDEFCKSDDCTWEDIENSWRNGIFLDRDAPDFLAATSFKYLDDEVENFWEITNDNENIRFALPDRNLNKYTVQGRYKPTVSFVSNWLRCIRFLFLKDEKSYWKIGCAMICQILDLRYIKKGDLTLEQWNKDFKDSKFKNVTWNDMSTYLGIVVLDDYMDKEQLAINYSIIVEKYRNLSEKHVSSVFKLSNIKKDEFGTEAQMFFVSDWTKDRNNAVDTFLKGEDKNKAVAAGVFNFTKKVDYNASDRMYLKNTCRSIISNLVTSFSRK